MISPLPDTPPRRQIAVNMTDLLDALNNSAWEMNYYLDLETGEVCLVTEETQHQLEALYEEVYDADGHARLPVADAIEQAELPDWIKEGLRLAHQIEGGLAQRYLAIPKADAHEDYNDMLDFAYTVSSPRLQNKLLDALHQRHPFRRFKDVLAYHPQERERWFAFSDARELDRARDWLEAQGLEAA